MAGRPVRIGDQLVLEEDYDETYIPSEQGKGPGADWHSSSRAGIISGLVLYSDEQMVYAQGCSVYLG